MTPSEPDRRPAGPRRPVRTFSPFWLMGGVLLLMVVATGIINVVSEAGEIEYSQFKSLVSEGRVSSAIMTADKIHGEYLNGSNQVTPYSTVRIEDPKLLELLESKNVHYKATADNRWVGEVLSWVLPLLVIVGIWIFFTRRIGGTEGGIMSFGRSRAKIFSEEDVKVSFTDVAGVDEAADELREIVEFLKNPKKYTTIGGRIPKGVLLVGPPGTGKTLLARAVAGEAHVPFFSLSGSDFVEMFVGVGAARVRDLFRQAESKAPCIVFIDELDALGKVRMQSPMGGHEEREQTLNQLLSEMDGFDAKKGVIVMAATNRPEVLDPALMRPGRFDRQVLVDKPDVKGREAILRIHARTVKLASDVDLAVIAARTAGFAGADLANLVNEAALLAARRDKPAADRKDFDEAIDRVIAGLEKKRAMNPRIRRIVAVHESGHAIVATVLPGGDPVHKVSIVARGFGALGYTMQLPLEDRYLLTKTELENQLAVLLGGRTAELLEFNEFSTGAQNDLLRATDIARAMVTEFGMSADVGPINHEGRRRNTFLESPYPPERGLHAEQTAQLIDSEIRRIVTSAEALARKVLEERRDILVKLSDQLLEQEVVEGDQLRELLGVSTPVAALPAASVAAEGH